MFSAFPDYSLADQGACAQTSQLNSGLLVSSTSVNALQCPPVLCSFCGSIRISTEYIRDPERAVKVSPLPHPHRVSTGHSANPSKATTAERHTQTKLGGHVFLARSSSDPPPSRACFSVLIVEWISLLRSCESKVRTGQNSHWQA